MTGISNKVAGWRDRGVKIAGGYVAELMWIGINVALVNVAGNDNDDDDDDDDDDNNE